MTREESPLSLLANDDPFQDHQSSCSSLNLPTPQTARPAFGTPSTAGTLEDHSPPAVLATPTLPTLAIRKIIFLDLDDTLIPTVWMRTSFLSMRSSTIFWTPQSGFEGLPATSADILNIPGMSITDILPYFEVRKKLETECRDNHLEDIVVGLIRAIGQYADRSIIVTNARSRGWLKLVELLFPKLSAELRKYNIEVLKTTPETKDCPQEPNMFRDPKQYFKVCLRSAHVCAMRSNSVLDDCQAS
eukprot:Blabericola_migrator_1__8883@NODE_46_length_16830_cov_132_783392_g42_i0_p8_GENE_NODE_46_length_16830_cov_132_783392_g42_i0NODE_46_length_16830_cov_132_783392_g42_i0_p8_ORF_typecomplete_len245_score29_46FSIP2/PF15783_5/0_16DUF705/PF05152_12/0_31_NODE_46_length_16830_cov_132_783392_g42_i051625896